MAVTIKDVARAAGVSPATVCRALTVTGRVKATTRARILAAVDDLGYLPNRAARGLSTGRTGNIGLIVPDLANPFFPGLIKGMQARARDADYAVFLGDTDEDAAVETSLVRAMCKQVDGIVLGSPRMSEDDLRPLAGETALVLLNRRISRIPSVVADNVDGMRQAVAHLVALGHRRIAYVGGPRNSWSTRERLRGLRAVARAAQVELIEVGHFAPQFAGGVAAADLVHATRVSAVIAFNDLVAIGLISRLRARDVRVPADVSVIGVDDIALAAMVDPPLTTVALPNEQLGRAGVDLLLTLIENPDRAVTTRRELDVQLMVRGSTAPARIVARSGARTGGAAASPG